MRPDSVFLVLEEFAPDAWGICSLRLNPKATPTPLVTLRPDWVRDFHAIVKDIVSATPSKKVVLVRARIESEVVEAPEVVR